MEFRSPMECFSTKTEWNVCLCVWELFCTASYQSAFLFVNSRWRIAESRGRCTISGLSRCLFIICSWRSCCDPWRAGFCLGASGVSLISPAVICSLCFSPLDSLQIFPPFFYSFTCCLVHSTVFIRQLSCARLHEHFEGNLTLRLPLSGIRSNNITGDLLSPCP